MAAVDQLNEDEFLALCRQLDREPLEQGWGYIVTSLDVDVLPLFRGCRTARYKPAPQSQPDTVRGEVVWRRPVEEDEGDVEMPVDLDLEDEVEDDEGGPSIDAVLDDVNALVDSDVDAS
jgi:hypothetical protein